MKLNLFGSPGVTHMLVMGEVREIDIAYIDWWDCVGSEKECYELLNKIERG